MPVCKICDTRFWEARIYDSPPEPEEPCECNACLYEIEYRRDRIMRFIWSHIPPWLLSTAWAWLLRWAGYA